MPFKSILVPTDFSAQAERALDVAIWLARGLRAPIHLLSSYYIGVDDPMPTRFFEDLRHDTERRLRELEARLISADVAFSSEAVADRPSEAIVTRASRRGDDLIVMGTRGRTGLTHVLLGSTAERVLRAAPCPAISVGALRNPTFGLATILVPVDFSGSAERTLGIAKELAQIGTPARVVLLHAHSVPPDIAYLFREMGGDLPEPRVDAAREQLESLRRELQESGVTCELMTVPGAAGQVIVDVARDVAADLIVMGTHARTGLSHLFLGSVAERVVRTAPCPVLTARPLPA